MRPLIVIVMLPFILLLGACDSAPTVPTTPPTAAPTASMPPAPTAPPVAPTATAVATATSIPPAPTAPPMAPTATAAATGAPTPAPLPSPTARPLPLPTLGVTLPITRWTVDTLLVGPGNPGRLYALQRGDVLDVTPTYTGPITLLIRLFTSDDFGTTWRLFPGGLPMNNASCISNLSMDYAQVDALYASTCAGIYRWNGTQWTRISEQKTGTLAITYGKPNIMWATGFSPGPYVLRSEDGGVTWQRADTDLVTFSGMANIGIDPRDGKTIYGMINPKYAGSYLRRGDASGRWVTMPVPENGYTYIGMTIDGATGAMYVASMQNNLRWQLWRSPNPSEADLKQVRWEMVHDFGDPSLDTFPLVLASGSHPQGLALFVRFDKGNCSPLQGIPCTSSVLRSLDGGKTWSSVPIPDK